MNESVSRSFFIADLFVIALLVFLLLFEPEQKNGHFSVQFPFAFSIFFLSFFFLMVIYRKCCNFSKIAVSHKTALVTLKSAQVRIYGFLQMKILKFINSFFGFTSFLCVCELQPALIYVWYTYGSCRQFDFLQMERRNKKLTNTRLHEEVIW